MRSLIIKPVATAVALVGLYAAVGYLVVPAGINWAVNNTLPSALNGKNPQLGSVSFNPWTWRLALNDLSLEAKEGTTPIIKLKSLIADVSLQSLWTMTPIVEEITVDGLDLHLTTASLGTASASKTSQNNESNSTTPSKTTLPAFSLSNVHLTNSSVTLTNHKNNSAVAITDINFALPIISTLPTASESNITPSLSLKIDGQPILAEGSANKEQAQLKLVLDQINLAKLIKASPIVLNYDIRSAKLNADLDFIFTLKGNPNVQSSGAIAVTGIDVRNPNGSSFVSATELAVQLADFNLLKQNIAFTKVSAQNASASVMIDSSPKSSNAFSSTSTSTQATGGNTAWHWSVEDVDVKNAQLTITDRGVRPAAVLKVSGINVATQKLGSDIKTPGNYSMSAKLANGSVSSQGQLQISPVKLEATTTIKQISLATFNPWIKSYASSQLSRGTLIADGKVQFEQAKTIKLSWLGDVSLNDLQAKNLAGKTLMSWKSVAASGVNLRSIEPMNFEIEQLMIQQPAQKISGSISQGAQVAQGILKLLGKNKEAEKAQKVQETVNKDIILTDIIYADGRFAVNGKDSNSVKQATESLILETLNEAFAVKKSQ